MGGFIIGDENGCNRCGRVIHDDGSLVTWVCHGCGKRVCRYCVLTDGTGVIKSLTLCSTECETVERVEAVFEGFNGIMGDD
jgi:hypothetical protein